MKKLTLCVLMLFSLSCGIFQSNLKVRNMSHQEISFYMNDIYKNKISSGDSKTYEVESGTHTLEAKVDSVSLIKENITIKTGHDAIWTVYGKSQANYDEN